MCGQVVPTIYVGLYQGAGCSYSGWGSACGGKVFLLYIGVWVFTLYWGSVCVGWVFLLYMRACTWGQGVPTLYRVLYVRQGVSSLYRGFWRQSVPTLYRVLSTWGWVFLT